MDREKQKKMMELVGEYRAVESRESWLNRETKRHLDNLPLFEAMIRKAFPDTTQVIAGHHIMFMREGHPHPHEIASADTLIFDHDVAQACWGEMWRDALTTLAQLPAAKRDDAVRIMFNAGWHTAF